MAFIPSPPPPNDLGIHNGAQGTGFPKNGTWPVYKPDGPPGITHKGTNQLGEPNTVGQVPSGAPP